MSAAEKRATSAAETPDERGREALFTGATTCAGVRAPSCARGGGSPSGGDRPESFEI
ncbi:hypothetical protein F511_47599 [Dorcoceras hygrometricum]|uniref:Uncharacterized protein n=1 Tax=Dorcoceras hygrometricum TaxID=472368 RepID=A0A2Z6ZQQ1_9LAMI|nr:hypothetical protein F511_47599 [Dorcoceras hygrometricum]